MKSLKLTPKEKEIFAALSTHVGSILFKHVKPTGLICYRHLDKDRNPLANFPENKIQSLIEKEVLAIDGHGIVTRASIETNKAQTT